MIKTNKKNKAYKSLIFSNRLQQGKINLYYSSHRFSHVIAILFLITMISFPTLFHVTTDVVHYFTDTTFFLPRMIAKSDVDTRSGDIILDHKFDGGHI